MKIILLLLLYFIKLINSFSCYGDNATNIKYNNTGELVPNLWQARILTPGWSSQYATHYVAYLFMKEKLGMNVTFYPYPETPQWFGTQTENGIDYDYPYYYWQLIRDDYYDLTFEVWPLMGETAGSSSYYAAGTVERSFIGSFGIIGWYLPKYFTDDYPTAIVPNVLATDTTIRNLIIDGSRNGTTNYYELYEGKTSFDWPNKTDNNGSLYPIIWGSVISYSQSSYSYRLTKNLDLNLSFVALGSEGLLNSLVKDLYDQRLPFIANIYVPDDNFALLDSTANNSFFEYEKVALPFNSGQSVDVECYQNATCANPLEPLRKLKNPKLDDRFPEMAQYWSGFEITADQIALIQSKYTLLNDSSLSEHEKWLNAACDFLKDPDSEITWNTDGWQVSINRWDCVPGCGILTSDNTYIGATCDSQTESSIGGTCICLDDRLTGDLCDISCPGTGSKQLENSSFVLEFCSGHGICDDITRSCSCEDGYGNDDCGTKFSTFVFNIGLAGFLIFVSCVLTIAGIGCIVWLRMNAKYKTVKALSVDLTTLFTLGVIFLALSNIPLVTSVTDASCCAWQWLFGVGGILAIMSPLLKAYRVSRVFHGGKMLRAVKITDKMLMKTLLKAVLLEIIICVVYTILHQIEGGTEIYYNKEELRKEYQCNQSSLTGYVSLGSYAYFFIMLCALTKYSYGTRRALSVFKESTCAYFSSFLSLFCTLITFGFNAATNDPLFRNSVQSFAVVIVVIEVLIMFYGTRIWTFFKEPENRNVTDARTISSTTTSSTTANFSNNISPPKPGPQNA